MCPWLLEVLYFQLAVSHLRELMPVLMMISGCFTIEPDCLTNSNTIDLALFHYVGAHHELMSRCHYPMRTMHPISPFVLIGEDSQIPYAT